MSEKTRKTEIIQNEVGVVITKPNKQKHNSKRRRNKKKAFITTEEGSEISKVDEVVNFLCKSISKNESEASLDVNLPVKVAKELPKPVETCTGQNCNPNLKSIAPSQSLTSSKELSNLFENLQVHPSKNPIKQNNIIDFLNIDLLKKNKSDSQSVEDLERIKQEMLKKNLSLNKEVIYIPNESLKEYFSFSMIQDSSETSFIAQSDSDFMELAPDAGQTFHSNLPKIEEKETENKNLNNYFCIEALTKEEDNLATVPSTSKLLVKELEKTTLKSETQANSKKVQKKKYKNKKINVLSGQNEVSTWSPRVFLNSELQKSNPKEQALNSSQHGKLKKKQNSTENDMKYPKYLSKMELQSISNYGVLFSGIIRINQKNYKEAYITAPDKGMDILIEGLKDRNRALEGDEVYFVLKPKEHHRVSTDSTDIQRTAVVVGIKTLNHNRGAIGSLNEMKNKNNVFALFSPRDSRLPRMRIRKKFWPNGFAENSNNFKDRLYFAKILQWNDLRYADGELIKEVGVIGDLDAETDAILLKYGLDVTPYSDACSKFIPPLTHKISEMDIENREDLRKECIFTIDPQSAVDLDDAVSCKLLSNGNYEVGVHISDVSYFLEEGTALDIAVSKRATTIYLVQKTYHMLPFELCRLCSLTPGEDKLSFSVIWEITQDCQIIKHRFARSVINSCAQLSYDQVQAVIENLPSKDSLLPKIHGGHSSEKIKDIILFLHKVAVYLRNKRFSTGALKIDQKKIYFSLNENKLPIEYHQEVHDPSHQLIEEFMLLANQTVAETLNSVFPNLAFLRSHPPPLPYVLEKLQKTFEKYGIILNISSSKAIQASLLKYSGDDKESAARMLVLNNALARPMARAKYYCGGLCTEEADRRHYALNISLYTHFTSPIRRYADIMVHRLLAASMHYCDPPKWTTDYVQCIASNCNRQKYAAKMAQEMSIELYLALYISQQNKMVCEAVVCDIKDKSFDCIGISTGIHQRLYFEHIKGDLQQEKENGILRLRIKWPKDEDNHTETIQIIEMFSIVKIELKRANVLKIEAKLLRYQ